MTHTSPLAVIVVGFSLGIVAGLVKGLQAGKPKDTGWEFWVKVLGYGATGSILVLAGYLLRAGFNEVFL